MPEVFPSISAAVFLRTRVKRLISSSRRLISVSRVFFSLSSDRFSTCTDCNWSSRAFASCSSCPICRSSSAFFCADSWAKELGMPINKKPSINIKILNIYEVFHAPLFNLDDMPILYLSCRLLANAFFVCSFSFIFFFRLALNFLLSFHFCHGLYYWRLFQRLKLFLGSRTLHKDQNLVRLANRLYALRNKKIFNLNSGFKNRELRYIHPNFMRKIFGKRLHFNFLHYFYQNSAIIFHRGRFPHKCQRNFGTKHFVHPHRVKIRMQHIPANRVARNILNQNIKLFSLNIKLHNGRFPGFSIYFFKFLIGNRNRLGSHSLSIHYARQKTSSAQGFYLSS